MFFYVCMNLFDILDEIIAVRFDNYKGTVATVTTTTVNGLVRNTCNGWVNYGTVLKREGCWTFSPLDHFQFSNANFEFWNVTVEWVSGCVQP